MTIHNSEAYTCTNTSQNITHGRHVEFVVSFVVVDCQASLYSGKNLHTWRHKFTDYLSFCFNHQTNMSSLIIIMYIVWVGLFISNAFVLERELYELICFKTIGLTFPHSFFLLSIKWMEKWHMTPRSLAGETRQKSMLKRIQNWPENIRYRWHFCTMAVKFITSANVLLSCHCTGQFQWLQSQCYFEQLSSTLAQASSIYATHGSYETVSNSNIDRTITMGKWLSSELDLQTPM